MPWTIDEIYDFVPDWLVEYLPDRPTPAAPPAPAQGSLIPLLILAGVVFLVMKK